MTDARGGWLSSKVTFPVLALVLVGAVIGVGKCPALSPMATDFTLPVVSNDGKVGPDRMRLFDQRGKVVLVDFWATWCPPCIASTPILVRISHKYRDRGLVVMGVNVDREGPEIVPAFMRRFNMDYSVLYDSTGSASDAYKIEGLPTLVVIDRQGRVRHRHVGLADEGDVTDMVEGLL